MDFASDGGIEMRGHDSNLYGEEGEVAVAEKVLVVFIKSLTDKLWIDLKPCS